MGKALRVKERCQDLDPIYDPRARSVEIGRPVHDVGAVALDSVRGYRVQLLRVPAGIRARGLEPEAALADRLERAIREEE